MLCKGRITFSSVFSITDRKDIGLYDVPMLMYLLGLGIGIDVGQFQNMRYLVVVDCSVVYVREVL